MRSIVISLTIFLIAVGAKAQVDAGNSLSERPKSRAVRDADITEEQLKYGGYLYADADMDIYVQSIVDHLLAGKNVSLPFRVRVWTQRNWMPLIDLLPNGALYISSGLLARLRDEAQIAGFIARHINHELAETRSLRHSFRGGGDAPSLATLETRFADENTVRMLMDVDLPADSASDALIRLADTLQAEQRQYRGSVNDPKWLRAEAKKLQAVKLERRSQLPVAMVPRFMDYLRALTLDLVQDDIESFRTAQAFVVLNRYDSELGADGRAMYLRAENTYRGARAGEDLEAVLALLHKAVNYPDAPPQAFKRMALLLRERGAIDASGAAFRQYLSRFPEAVDAPIVRAYLQ